MTGPEHYREAERLIAGIKSNPAPGNDLDAQTDRNTVLAAQVHATLAIAAATAEAIAVSYDSDYDTAIPRAWSAAIS